MVWASIIWAGGKILERKWFGPPLFGRGGNNERKMVWASIIWVGGKIMDGKWFGSPLFLRVRPAQRFPLSATKQKLRVGRWYAAVACLPRQFLGATFLRLVMPPPRPFLLRLLSPSSAWP